MPLAGRIKSFFDPRPGSLGAKSRKRRASETVHRRFSVDRLTIPDNTGSSPQQAASSGKTAAPRKRRITHWGNRKNAARGYHEGSELLPGTIPDLQTEIFNSRAYKMRRNFEGDSLSGDSDELTDRWSVGTRESGRSVRSLPLESPSLSVESLSLQRKSSWPGGKKEAYPHDVGDILFPDPFSSKDQISPVSPTPLHNRSTEHNDIQSDGSSSRLPLLTPPWTRPFLGPGMPYSQFPRVDPYDMNVREAGPFQAPVPGSMNYMSPDFERNLYTDIPDRLGCPAGPPNLVATGIAEHLLGVTYQDRHTVHPSNEKCAGMWIEKEVIGQGGQGTVFLEQCSQTLQLRAVKRIPVLVVKSNNLDIVRELRAMIAVIEFEEHFVKFYGWYHDPVRDSLCIAMEYLPCGDLKQHLQNYPIQAQSQAPIIAKQLLQALRILHSKCICHRDLKPQNVLIASLEPLRVKLADFGVAKSTQGTQLRTRIGTLNYMAPELLGLGTCQLSYTPAVDMWALGCLLHELITGKIPFECVPDDDVSGISDISRRAANQPSINMDRLFEFTRGRLELPVHILEAVGAAPTCIMFISKLLHAQPQFRMTPSDALDDLWITMDV